MVEVSWSRADEGVTLLVFFRASPGGKFREVKLVFDSLERLRSGWPHLAAAIEDHGGSHGRAVVLPPGREN